jgi:hypothetical protein
MICRSRLGRETRPSLGMETQSEEWRIGRVHDKKKDKSTREVKRSLLYINEMKLGKQCVVTSDRIVDTLCVT